MPMENPTPNIGERVLAGAFGTCFGGVGLAVLSMNLFSWGSFHSPPVFFRIFGICMSIPFIAVGGTLVVAAITGKKPKAFGQNLRDRASHLLDQADRASRREATAERRASYACPHCGAPLGDGADISPSGDVKCDHCRAWFNVR